MPAGKELPIIHMNGYSLNRLDFKFPIISFNQVFWILKYFQWEISRILVDFGEGRIFIEATYTIQWSEFERILRDSDGQGSLACCMFMDMFISWTIWKLNHGENNLLVLAEVLVSCTQRSTWNARFREPHIPLLGSNAWWSEVELM